MRNALTGSCVALAAVFGLAGAMMPPNHVSGSDTTFATKFAAAGNAEIAMAQVALARSKNPRVVAFAKQITADETKAGADLRVVSDKKGLSITSQPNPADRSIVDKLKSMPDNQFDSLYKTDNVRGQTAALALLEVEIGSGKDADLKKFATMARGIVVRDLRMTASLPTT